MRHGLGGQDAHLLRQLRLITGAHEGAQYGVGQDALVVQHNVRTLHASAQLVLHHGCSLLQEARALYPQSQLIASLDADAIDLSHSRQSEREKVPKFLPLQYQSCHMLSFS